VAEVLYLDSSAIVKLVVAERESTALRGFLSRYPAHVTSGLARAEVIRAARRHDPAAASRAVEALRRLLVLDVTSELLESAGMLDPPALRTLDAIHLVSALTLVPDLTAVVTYDTTMAKAASAAGLPVRAPA
jgi:uncharacterized protein